jgi:hypothetical protein
MVVRRLLTSAVPRLIYFMRGRSTDSRSDDAGRFVDM